VSTSLQEIFLEQKLHLNEEIKLYISDDPLSNSSRLLGEGVLMNDDEDRLFIKLNNTNKPLYITLINRFTYHQDTNSISWQQRDQHYKIQFDEKFAYEEVRKQFMKYEKNIRDKGYGSIDFGMKSISEELDQNDNTSEEQSPSYSYLSNKYLKQPSNIAISKMDQTESQNSNLSISSSPSSNNNDPDDISFTFQYSRPYHRAIKTIRKLSYLKSPRDKLGCILQTFKEIISDVGNFWERYEREVVVGADDLVPIFAYVVLNSNIPKIFSEMNFIGEFATDSDMNGKYGYVFATFQISVEIVMRLDDTIWDSIEQNTDTDKSSIPEIPQEDIKTSTEILEKRQLLVSKRSKNIRENSSENEE